MPNNVQGERPRKEADDSKLEKKREAAMNFIKATRSSPEEDEKEVDAYSLGEAELGGEAAGRTSLSGKQKGEVWGGAWGGGG